MKNSSGIISLIVVIALMITFSFSCPAVSAADGDTFPVEQYLDEIADCLCKENKSKSLQKLLDGPFSDNPAGGAEWYVMAFRNKYTDLYFETYRYSLEQYVKENNIKSETTRLRLALALHSLDSEAYFDSGIKDLSEQSGIMSWVFCLHLANNGIEGKLSSGELIDIILGYVHPDGGWSVLGDESDPDVTAMTVQALAPHTENADVHSAVENGIRFLSNAQQSDGGYYSMGALNCESSCQVLMALCSVGIDAEEDTRFIKNGNTVFDAIRSFEASPGKYCHVKGDGGNTACTTQVYLAFSCYDIFLKGNEAFYVFGPLVEGKAPPTQISFKSWLYIATAAAFLIYCTVIFLRGKRKAKGYIFALCALMAVTAAITFVNVSSPEKYYGDSSVGNTKTFITIDCSSIAGQRDYIPVDGMILNKVPVMISDGDTAREQLVLATKQHKLQLEYDGTGYVCGLGNVYEFDFGNLSGWVFRVNGETPGKGSYDVILQEGDSVEWIYSLELGKDID